MARAPKKYPRKKRQSPRPKRAPLSKSPRRAAKLATTRTRMQGFVLEPEESRNRDRMWAPWRMEYIKGHSKAPKSASTCILCGLTEQADGEENLILTRTKHAYVVMNRYPYTNGHVMVVPLRHTDDFASLSAEEALDLMKLMQRAVSAMQNTIRAQGFNIGMNIGRVAGAGIDEHLHFHVVPRWNGDTNFMPVLADVNLVNDHLIPCYRMLREEILNPVS